MDAYGPTVIDAYTSCSQFVAGNLSWSAVVDPCFCIHNRSLDDADAQLPYYEIHYCALPCAPAVMCVLAALWLKRRLRSIVWAALPSLPRGAFPGESRQALGQVPGLHLREKRSGSGSPRAGFLSSLLSGT